jgi:hypothetical protein
MLSPVRCPHGSSSPVNSEGSRTFHYHPDQSIKNPSAEELKIKWLKPRKNQALQRVHHKSQNPRKTALEKEFQRNPENRLPNPESIDPGHAISGLPRVSLPTEIIHRFFEIYSSTRIDSDNEIVGGGFYSRL